MTIFGIGVDIVLNSRMARILNASYAQRFLVKVLHPKEISEIESKKTFDQKVSYLATRWSYKEACVKACGKKELIFPKIYLIKDEDGKPTVVFEQENK